jgi:hypothetical protein
MTRTLYSMLRESDGVHDVQIHDYEDAVVLAVALQSNSTLLFLEIASLLAGVGVIAESLTLNYSLQELRLSNCWLGGDYGSAVIAGAISRNSCLQTLFLCNNRIRDAGATAFAEALTLNNTLRVLNLRRNYIGNVGARAFAEVFKLKASIPELDLSNNHVGTSGLAAMAEALEFSLVREHGLARPLHFQFSSGNRLKEELKEEVAFLKLLLRLGFRTFCVYDVPQDLWPQALAKVSNYPSLLLHLVHQIQQQGGYFE